MKKRTIWTIASIMGFSFLALLFLQLKYIQEMVDMKKEQFDESVNRALYQASRNLELNETLRYLEKDVNETKTPSLQEGLAWHTHRQVGRQHTAVASILGYGQGWYYLLVVRA